MSSWLLETWRPLNYPPSVDKIAPGTTFPQLVFFFFLPRREKYFKRFGTLEGGGRNRNFTKLISIFLRLGNSQMPSSNFMANNTSLRDGAQYKLSPSDFYLDYMSVWNLITLSNHSIKFHSPPSMYISQRAFTPSAKWRSCATPLMFKILNLSMRRCGKLFRIVRTQVIFTRNKFSSSACLCSSLRVLNLFYRSEFRG